MPFAGDKQGLLSSDSSMDDCNDNVGAGADSTRLVQIPLWTIVTLYDEFRAYRYVGSDSSMDDCNPKNV